MPKPNAPPGQSGRALSAVATLHEARDICAISATPGTNAAIAAVEAADIAAVAGRFPRVATMALAEGRDVTAIAGNVVFLNTATLNILENPDGPAPPQPSVNSWQSIPYNPVTVNYWDNRPVAQYIGPPATRIPYGSKHMRSAWRAITGRLYFGWGDWDSTGTGLPCDQGPSSANAAFLSMDPLTPNVVTLEQHRYIFDTTQIQDSACDEGATDWNTTSDKLTMSPVDAFDMFAIIDPSLIPTYVSLNVFSLPGDQTAKLYADQRLRLFLDSTSFPSFVPSQWVTVPSWIDVRVTTFSYNGSVTTVNFTNRPDVTPLLFDRNAKGMSFGVANGVRGSAWLDNGIVYFKQADSKYYACLLEWTPTTRRWARHDFVVGVRKRVGGTDFGGLTPRAFLNGSNGTFVPAAVTGRGDEFIMLNNSGPDGGWFGSWVFQYNTNTVDFIVNDAVNVPADYFTASISRDVPGYDPVGRVIWQYSSPEAWLYRYNIVTQQVQRWIQLPEPAGVVIGGCGHTCWNADIGAVEIYADQVVPGFGCPTQYLYYPATNLLQSMGNALPSGERIRGDEFYRAGDRTVADGGQFNPDGSDGTPPNRQIFIGKNLLPPASSGFEKLSVAAHQRVVPVWGDLAATDSAPTTTELGVPFRHWGGFTVSPQGIAYYRGGGHSEYQGSEVDWCDLNAISGTIMTWTMNLGPPFTTGTFRRTHVPQYPDSIYFGAGSPYLWFNATEWQPTGPHMYARNTTHPTLGFLHDYKVPTNLVMPANNTDSIGGIASWSRTTAKWTGQAVIENGVNEWFADQSYFSDWNTTLNKLVIFSGTTSRDRLYVLEWVPGATVPTQRAQIYPNTIVDPGQFCSYSFWLENDKYVICTDGQFKVPQMFIWLHTAGTLTTVTSASYSALYNSDAEGVYAAADRDHRKIWWLVGNGASAPQVYYSSFDTPANVQPYAITDNAVFRPAANSKSVGGHKGLQYFAGYLWMATPSVSFLTGNQWHTTDFWRMAVS